MDSLNDNFGGESDLKDLVSSLHSREMLLMLDINVNYMGANSTPANVSYLWPLNNATEDFHTQCAITDETDQQQVENCWLSYGNNNFSLPDINTENQTVVDMLNMWINSTVGKYNIDGIRLEAAKNVPQAFWPAFAANASVFTIGEVVSDSIDYAQNYTHVLDSVLDYPTYYVASKSFSSPDNDLSQLASAMASAQQKYAMGSFASGAFVENHDVPRLPSVISDKSLIMNALAWTFGGDAMPIVYYGQEQGFDGAGDPDNREALWLNGLNPMGPFVSTITNLNAARHAAQTYSPDFFNTTTKIISPSSSSLVLVKSPLLTLLSNGGNSSSTSWNVSGSDTGYAPDTVLLDLLTCQTTTTGSDGGVNVQSESGQPKVYVPRVALDGNLMCGPQERAVKKNSASRAAVDMGTLSFVMGLVTLISFII